MNNISETTFYHIKNIPFNIIIYYLLEIMIFSICIKNCYSNN